MSGPMRAGWSFGAALATATLSVAALSALLLSALLLSVVVATPAHAEDPVGFGASHIVDTAHALGDRQGEVTAALDRLYADTHTDLYVAFVANFTGAADRQQWAGQTADKNGFGTNDVLLAVSTGDHLYQLSVAPDFALTDAQLQSVETDGIEPALRVNDWAAAAIGAARGLAAVSHGEPVAPPPIASASPSPAAGSPSPGPASGGPSVFWLAIIALLILAALLVVVGIIVYTVRAGRASGQPTHRAAPAAPVPASTERLRQEAASALVQTDDAVKTSEQELGFAVAQYGEGATGAFQAALGTAGTQLTRAFTLQQRLDDAEPDTEAQRREWYTEIVRLCAQANAALDEQAADFDKLRKLEKNASQAAASVADDVAAVGTRVARAEAGLVSLARRYGDGALATVADNPRQAEDRIAFATNVLADANAKLAAREKSAAAVGIRAAEESVDQAKLLLDAVDRLGVDLDRAAAAVTASVTDLEADLTAARSLSGGAEASARLRDVIENTDRTLAEVRASLAAGRIDPFELGRRLDAVNAQMDAALRDVRDAEAGAQRARATLDQALLAARSQVSAAGDFITARRGAVGAEARTRLATADRLIGQAESVAATDPAGALAAAQRAGALAAEAISLARTDVGAFPGAGGDGLGDIFGGQGGAQGGNGSLGAILGGILIGSILGGGSGRHGGSGFTGPGSFGGSGTRSRRGGGGRF